MHIPLKTNRAKSDPLSLLSPLLLIHFYPRVELSQNDLTIQTGTLSFTHWSCFFKKNNTPRATKSCYHQIQGKKFSFQVSISIEKHLVSWQEKRTSPVPLDAGATRHGTEPGGSQSGPAQGDGGCQHCCAHRRSPYKLRGSGPRVCLIQACGHQRYFVVVFCDLFFFLNSFKTNWWMRSTYALVWTLWF